MGGRREVQRRGADDTLPDPFLHNQSGFHRGIEMLLRGMVQQAARDIGEECQSGEQPQLAQP